MKILFIGAVESSEVLLKTLVEMGETPVGVVTKKKSSFNSDFVDVSYLVKDLETPIFYFTNENKQELLSWVQSIQPDIIFCFGWSHLLDENVLKLATLGAIGFHPSPLPLNRGRHPIVWTLALGLKQTASSFFYIDLGVDEGDIVSQSLVSVDDEDDARTLYNKIMQAAVKQVRSFVPRLKNNQIQPLKQDHSLGNSWRKRTNKDSLIDFRMSAVGIYNLVRALTKPYLGAEAAFQEKVYKVWKAKVSNEDVPENLEPGKVLRVKGNEMTVKCQGGAIVLLDHELPSQIQVGDYL